MTSESLESLPCPLCGGPAELWRASGTAPPRPAFIGCLGRCCVLVSREYATDAEAVAAWNTRTPQGVASAAANPNASDAPAQGVDVGKLREVLTSAQSELADCCAGNKWREHQTLADVRRALEILATPSSEGEGASEAAKVAAYEDAHATAVDLGYPSITEALETLDATPSPVSPAIGGEVARLVSEDDVVAVLQSACNRAGSVLRWARANGVTDEQAYLCLRRKRPPEPAILKALGLERAVLYRPSAAAPGFSKLCLGGAERSDCETNPNTNTVLQGKAP